MGIQSNTCSFNLTIFQGEKFIEKSQQWNEYEFEVDERRIFTPNIYSFKLIIH